MNLILTIIMLIDQLYKKIKHINILVAKFASHSKSHILFFFVCAGNDNTLYDSYLSMRKQCLHSGIEVCQPLIFFASVNEYLVLQEIIVSNKDYADESMMK